MWIATAAYNTLLQNTFMKNVKLLIYYSWRERFEVIGFVSTLFIYCMLILPPLHEHKHKHTHTHTHTHSIHTKYKYYVPHVQTQTKNGKNF